jgi:hypothetical protein
MPQPTTDDFEPTPRIIAFPPARLQQLSELRGNHGKLAESPIRGEAPVMTLGMYPTYEDGRPEGWYAAVMGVNVPVIALEDGRLATVMAWSKSAMSARGGLGGTVITMEQLKTLRTKQNDDVI